MGIRGRGVGGGVYLFRGLALLASGSEEPRYHSDFRPAGVVFGICANVARPLNPNLWPAEKIRSQAAMGFR
jgi:hypothetical protein